MNREKGRKVVLERSSLDGHRAANVSVDEPDYTYAISLRLSFDKLQCSSLG